MIRRLAQRERELLEILQRLETQGEPFRIDEVAELTGYKISTVKTYFGKKLDGVLVQRVDRGRWIVQGALACSEDHFSQIMSQKGMGFSSSASLKSQEEWCRTLDYLITQGSRRGFVLSEALWQQLQSVAPASSSDTLRPDTAEEQVALRALEGLLSEGDPAPELRESSEPSDPTPAPEIVERSGTLPPEESEAAPETAAEPQAEVSSGAPPPEAAGLPQAVETLPPEPGESDCDPVDLEQDQEDSDGLPAEADSRAEAELRAEADAEDLPPEPGEADPKAAGLAELEQETPSALAASDSAEADSRTEAELRAEADAADLPPEAGEADPDAGLAPSSALAASESDSAAPVEETEAELRAEADAEDLPPEPGEAAPETEGLAEGEQESSSEPGESPAGRRRVRRVRRSRSSAVGKRVRRVRKSSSELSLTDRGSPSDEAELEVEEQHSQTDGRKTVRRVKRSKGGAEGKRLVRRVKRSKSGAEGKKTVRVRSSGRRKSVRVTDLSPESQTAHVKSKVPASGRTSAVKVKTVTPGKSVRVKTFSPEEEVEGQDPQQARVVSGRIRAAMAKRNALLDQLSEPSDQDPLEAYGTTQGVRRRRELLRKRLQRERVQGMQKAKGG